MKVACDSTVIIYLSKISRLELLKELFKEVLIPAEVYRETVEEGKRENHIDAADIENAISEGWIKVKQVKAEPIISNLDLDPGEAEAIALARQEKAAVLLDQSHARKAALLLKMQPRGTIYVLLLAIRKGIIDFDSFMLCLKDLVDVGFRMSPDVYIEAVRMGKELS
jgi:predicted nucleic acid-binding protein